MEKFGKNIHRVYFLIIIKYSELPTRPDTFKDTF